MPISSLFSLAVGSMMMISGAAMAAPTAPIAPLPPLPTGPSGEAVTVQEALISLDDPSLVARRAEQAATVRAHMMVRRHEVVNVNNCLEVITRAENESYQTFIYASDNIAHLVPYMYDVVGFRETVDRPKARALCEQNIPGTVAIYYLNPETRSRIIASPDYITALRLSEWAQRKIEGGDTYLDQMPQVIHIDPLRLLPSSVRSEQ